MSPADPKPIKAPKRQPRRIGVDSVVNPPEAFRVAVYERSGRRCVACGKPSGHPDTLPKVGAGAFDPAHLIPAQRIRAEYLADYVYDPRVAVWMCRDCHHAEDNGDRKLTQDLLDGLYPAAGWRTAWGHLCAVAAEMDAAIRTIGRHPTRTPFTSYVEARYP